MARRGAFELQEIVLRYSLDGGSSRGVREFVEHELLPFARENPHITIKTIFRNKHPNVIGRYVTGYARQLELRNSDRVSVRERFGYLRNSIGGRIPTHNSVGTGVVNRKKVSVQGFWVNSPLLTPPPQPQDIELRARREKDYGLAKMVDEVGIAGVVRITERLIEAQKKGKAEALERLPKKERIRATE